MDELNSVQLDKTAFEVISLFDESDDKRYWHKKSPSERLRALELMRQIIYGYDPTSIRLQRVLEVTQRSSSGVRTYCSYVSEVES